MEYQVKRIMYTTDEGNVVANEIVVNTNLCSHIQNELCGHIVFRNKEFDYDGTVYSNEKYPYLCFPHMEVDVDYDYEDEPYERYSEEYNYVEIKCCPICGEKFKRKVIEEIDVSSQIRPILLKIKDLESQNAKRCSQKRTREIFELKRLWEKIMEIDSTEENYISFYCGLY